MGSSRYRPSAMLLALALFFGQAHSGGWSSGRPPECASDNGGAGSTNVWERAKSPQLRRYCDLVASAASKLAGTVGMAEAALNAARQADEVVPGRAAPRVLEGRALAALGKVDDALAALREAKALDPTSFDDPLTLRVWARTLARTGHRAEAAAAYRALLPRTGSLSSAERASTAVEAGLVAMASGPARLDDAIAALREALHDAQDETLNVAVLALAVALDRRGDGDAARALLVERAHGDPRNVLEAARAKELLEVAPAERSALAGFALESLDAAGAHDAWEQYLEGLASDPDPVKAWAAHARAQLSGLGSGRSAGPRRVR